MRLSNKHSIVHSKENVTQNVVRSCVCARKKIQVFSLFTQIEEIKSQKIYSISLSRFQYTHTLADIKMSKIYSPQQWSTCWKYAESIHLWFNLNFKIDWKQFSCLNKPKRPTIARARTHNKKILWTERVRIQCYTEHITFRFVGFQARFGNSSHTRQAKNEHMCNSEQNPKSKAKQRP